MKTSSPHNISFKIDNNNAELTTTPLIENQTMSAPMILLTDELSIQNETQLSFLLNNIFYDDPAYAQNLQQMIIKADSELQSINSVVEVIKVLKRSFKDSINWEGFIPSGDCKHLQQLAEFEESAILSQVRYSDKGKPREKSIFWPNPVHPKHPSSRFDTLPYAQKHPLIDKTTPIGSAGSCFAIEIAHVLQEREFNYIITERADDPSTGVFVDGYKAGDKYAPGSFSSGIQFNTVNFKHLAEKSILYTRIQKDAYQTKKSVWNGLLYGPLPRRYLFPQ